MNKADGKERKTSGGRAGQGKARVAGVSRSLPGCAGAWWGLGAGKLGVRTEATAGEWG